MTIFSDIEEYYDKNISPVVKKVPILSQAIDYASDYVPSIITPRKNELMREIEEHKKINAKLQFQVDTTEYKIIEALKNTDYGNGMDFYKFVGLLEGHGYSAASDGSRYGNSGLNDVSIDEHKDTVDKTNNEAWRAFIRNPYAKRQVKWMTSNVVGDGHKVYSISHQVQSIIDQVMYDESNQMVLAQREMMNRYQIEGGFCALVTMIAPYGRTYIREIPTAEIEEIITDEDDSNKILGIVRKYFPRKWRIVDTQGGFRSPLELQDLNRVIFEIIWTLDWASLPNKRNQSDYIQDIVYVKNPTLSSRKRGLSDFASHLSWLNRLEKLGIARTVLNILRASIVWLHKVKGDSAEISRIKSSMDSQGTPPPGSTLLVNSNVEEWEPMAPNLQASDAQHDMDLVRGFVVTASGMSEQTATGDYGNSSFAGSKQASRDMIRVLEEPQAIFEYAEKRIYVRAIKAAMHYGTIKTIKLTIPKNTKDLGRLKLDKFIEIDDADKEIIKANYSNIIGLSRSLGLPESTIRENVITLRESDRLDDLIRGMKRQNVKKKVSSQDLPPMFAMAMEEHKDHNKKRLEALERSIKKENCWRSHSRHTAEFLEIWDDEMEYVVDYVMVKKDGEYVDKNLFDLIQVKFPFIQIEDPLHQAQALTLHKTNGIIDEVDYANAINHDINKTWERMRIHGKQDVMYGEDDHENEPGYNPDSVDDYMPEGRNPKSTRVAKPETDHDANYKE